MQKCSTPCALTAACNVSNQASRRSGGNWASPIRARRRAALVCRGARDGGRTRGRGDRVHWRPCRDPALSGPPSAAGAFLTRSALLSYSGRTSSPEALMTQYRTSQNRGAPMAPEEILSSAGAGRRDFLKKVLAGTTFAVPVITSFSMEGL